MLILGFAAAALVAFVVAATVAWLVARNASRLRLVDVPNERSSHQSLTPRGGGVGIVAGVAAGILVLTFTVIPLARDLAALLGGAAAMALLGAIDDRRSIPARYRLVVQAAVAVVVVILLGGVGRLPLPPPLDLPLGLLAAPLAVLWLVTVTNFYNFMDGIDGLAGGQAVASCAGVVIAVWSVGAVELAIVLAAAALGFLLLNSPPARIFLGDVGSTSLGFAIAGLPLLAPEPGRPMAVFAVAVGLSLFLLDPLETLFRLVRARRPIGVAHRAHSYQALASSRERHRVVTAGLVLAGLVLSLGGGLAYNREWLAWPVFVLALATFAAERFLAGRARGAARLGPQ
ncbi:MAG TPA: glycosyl transferase [Clostridia bacterium]|nr:glycosyl transferase [Clostridia bacterium]